MMLIMSFTIGSIRTYRNKVASRTFIPWPIEIRFCEPNNSTNQTKSPPRYIVAILISVNGLAITPFRMSMVQ